MTLLKVREWSELSVAGNSLTATETDRFQALAERAAKRLRLPESAVLARTSRGLKAGQVVGILAIPGHTLEILPKIDDGDDAVRKALIRMLAVAHDLRLAEGELLALGTQRYDLLELLIRLFADRLLAAVRRGLPRRYIASEVDLRLLRGRLDIVRQFTHLAVRPDRLACRFDELSEDMPLNRVLKAAVRRLSRLTYSTVNARLLSEIGARFEFTGDSPRPLTEAVSLDRTNSAFHDLYRLARLFLSGDWQTTTSGGSLGFTLLFPMNDLFEKFIGRSLQRALFPVPVDLQRGGRYALECTDGHGLFMVLPDAVIEPEGRPIVLDTKWKWLDSTRSYLGVEQDDVYQMLTYGRAWCAARVILVYPWQEKVGTSAGVVRRWHAAGEDRFPLDVATVDVRDPDGIVNALRSIVSYTSNDTVEAPPVSATMGG